MPWRRTLVLCAFCLWATPAFADQFDEVRGWLERMAEAMLEQDYQGTFVYVRGDDVEAAVKSLHEGFEPPTSPTEE